MSHKHLNAVPEEKGQHSQDNQGQQVADLVAKLEKIQQDNEALRETLQRRRTALTTEDCKAELGIGQNPVVYISRDHVERTKRLLDFGEAETGKRSFSRAFWALCEKHLLGEGS